MAARVDYGTASTTPANWAVDQSLFKWTKLEVFNRSDVEVACRADGSTAAVDTDENFTVPAGGSIVVDYVPSLSIVAASGSGKKVEVRGCF